MTRPHLRAVETNASPHPAARNFMKPLKPESVEDALRLQTGASAKGALGEAMIADGDTHGGRFALAEANTMAETARNYLDIASHVTGPVKAGNGGELIIATKEAMTNALGIVDTVNRETSDMVTASASRQRVDLAAKADVLTMGLDASESIRARNSLEKMLSHQMTAAHKLAMTFAAQSIDLQSRAAFNPTNQALSVEACRQANAAARMMASFQEGLLTLERIRRGGRQTVKVIHQHVQVGPGGQAVVAGAMKTGARKRLGRAGK